MAKNRKGETFTIVEEIYPIIESAIPANKNSYRRNIAVFIDTHSKQLYDYAPVDRIYFRQKEVNDYFKAIKTNKSNITNIAKTLYYYNEKEIEACKDEFSLSQLMAVRYFAIKQDATNTELSAMYLAFSGKFYASCHYRWFRQYCPKREVMDYVINYMLSKKFDLISEGSVWGAIRNLVRTWLESYKSIITGDKTSDEEIVYIVHQLYERIYAFMRNIAKLYYKAAEEKLYLNAESDNYDGEGGKYRVANNNSTKASEWTEKTMTYMTTSTVNIARCHSAAGKGVDAMELKSIFENILNDNDSIADLREVVNILLVDFMKNFPDIKDVPTSVEFIDYSIKMKPNTKDKDLIFLKNAILKWLNTSERYRSIRTPATLNNYYRGILTYIVLSINEANKG